MNLPRIWNVLKRIAYASRSVHAEAGAVCSLPTVEREVRNRMPVFTYPPECMDIAEETLAKFRHMTRRERPTDSETAIEWIARMRATAELEDRAVFRREIADTCEWLRQVSARK